MVIISCLYEGLYSQQESSPNHNIPKSQKISQCSSLVQGIDTPLLTTKFRLGLIKIHARKIPKGQSH